MVEMDGCQSKVGTFDFLLTEVAFDYLLAGFFYISIQNVWQFSEEVEKMPFEIVERLTVEDSVVL